MSMNNDAYAAALAEIEEGRLDKGTWARAFAESGGDESKAKARYIKARAESIGGSPTWSDTQPPVEEVTKKRIEPKTSSGTGWSAVQLGAYYEAAIGEKNSGYYTEKFHTFDKKGPGLHASWNWAAFFFTGFWALYRKMYAWFFAWWAVVAVGGVFFKMPNPQIEQGVALAYIACFLGFAAYANALYHRKVKVKITDAQRSISDPSRLNEGLSAGSGVNKWVPVVCGAIPVVGIVAAVALPAYQDYSKRRAMAATPVLAPAPQVDVSGSMAVPNTQTGMDWDKVVITPPSALPAQSSPQLSRSKPPLMFVQESVTEPAFSPQVQADLDAIAARAVSDFPYLDTPAGQDVLNKIAQKRDEYIRQGQYPSVALTNAVNAFAPANAPRPNQEKRLLPVFESGDRGNHSGFDPKCRWVTPQDWSCK